MPRTLWRLTGLGLVLFTILAAGSTHDATAQEIKLKLSHFAPTAHNHHANIIVPWVEEVKKRTNGRVEITVFPGASLCKPTQQYDCAKSGIADLAWGVTGWTPGRFPMTSVIELPFLVRTAAVSAESSPIFGSRICNGNSMTCMSYTCIRLRPCTLTRILNRSAS